MFMIVYEKAGSYENGSRVLGNTTKDPMTVPGDSHDIGVVDGPFDTIEEARTFLGTYEMGENTPSGFPWRPDGKIQLSCKCCTAKPVIVRVREKGEKGYWN